MTTLQSKEASLKEVIALLETDNSEAQLTNLVDPRLKGSTAMKFAAACRGNETKSSMRTPWFGQVVSALQKLQSDMEKSQVHSS